MTRQKPSELELQVLSVLWERKQVTVRELLAAMPDGKKRAYTTLLSVLQVMEKKALVAHDRSGLTHVYRPAVKTRQVLGPLLRGLVRNVFGGSPSNVLQSLITDADIGQQELAKIKELIENMNNDPRQGKGKAHD